MPYDNQPAYDRLVFELSSPGRLAFSLPESRRARGDRARRCPRSTVAREPAALPEVSELDVVRHYTRLSQLNYGVDTHFYPLGSCTMKYNPKINEDMARLARLRPPAPAGPRGARRRARCSSCTTSGAMLAEIAGMDAVSLQPAAGAQGELAGVLMIRAYHEARGEKRTKVLDPRLGARHQPRVDRARRLRGHRGEVGRRAAEVDLDDLERHLGAGRGGVHDHRAQHARHLRAARRWRSRAVPRHGRAGLHGRRQPQRHPRHHAPRRPRLRRLHFNLHKTFTTPHGGGGPGAGPVGVKAHLEPFLPVPVVAKTRRRRTRSTGSGRSRSASCRRSGATSACSCAPTPTSARWAPTGCARVSENAVLNANYIMKRLEQALRRRGARALHARVRAVGAPPEEARRDAPWTSPSACSISASTRPRPTSR